MSIEVFTSTGEECNRSSLCMCVSVSAKYLQKLRTDCDEIWWRDGAMPREESNRFWW